MKDITANFHQQNLFSVMANQSVSSSKEIIRAKIIAYIESQGLYGATSDEVELALGLTHQTASARLTEAKKQDRLVLNGTRKTRSGRNAGVLVAPEYREL